MVKESKEPYIVTNYDKEETKKTINNKHDKTLRMILTNKQDVAYIINKALNLKGKMKIAKEELETYKSSYITNKLENREADIVYKLKDKNIYFLIEHQTKEDYSMPYRLQEYGVEIKKSAIEIKKLKTKTYEIPTATLAVKKPKKNQAIK